MVAILMTQPAAFPAMTGAYRDFWDAVYEAAQRAPGETSSGSGSRSGSGSGSGSSSGSGSGGASSGGEDCSPGDGDSCSCVPGTSNGMTCSPASPKDPGACCQTSGGLCLCSAFLCYVNGGGGRDCEYTDLGENGLEVPTTSATGAACCVKGLGTSLGAFCSCYDEDDVVSCEGEMMVPSCTMDVVPPCSSDETQTPTCD